MSTTSQNSAHTEAADLLEQARDLAQNGHLKRAAQVYERILEAEPAAYHRARAALGLAVVLHDLGDVRASRQAARGAMATGEREFAPRAAYHLALSLEGEDALDEAEEAWRELLDFGNEGYQAVAHHGLARIAEARGDTEAAHPHWEKALEGPAAGGSAGPAGGAAATVEAARDYAGRLLARGEAEAAGAVVERGLAAADDPRLRLLLGAVHVERAVGEFGAVVEAGRPDPEGRAAAVDPSTWGSALELLARLLVLRGDPDAAERVWAMGLDHRDTETAAEVRTRLRRGLPAPDDAEEEAGAPWWDPYLEAALGSDSTPLLAEELFAALTQMYSHAAVPLAQDEAGPAALRATLAQVVGTPGEFVWGRSLHADFRERFRRAVGGDADVLPENWPDGV